MNLSKSKKNYLLGLLFITGTFIASPPSGAVNVLNILYTACENAIVASCRTLGVDKVVADRVFPGPFVCSRACSVHPESFKLECLDGVSLEADYYPIGVEKGHTLILFHGNAESRHSFSHYLGRGSIKNFNILTLSIRGYGNFDRDEKGKNVGYTSALDVEAALRFLVGEKKIPLDKISCYGVSLGASAYAAYAAKHFKTPALLDKPFPNLMVCAKSIEKPLTPILFAYSALWTGISYFCGWNCLSLFCLCSTAWYGFKTICKTPHSWGLFPWFFRTGLIKSFIANTAEPKLNNLGLFSKMSYDKIPVNSFDTIETLKTVDPDVPIHIISGKNDSLMGQESIKMFKDLSEECPNVTLHVTQEGHRPSTGVFGKFDFGFEICDRNNPIFKNFQKVVLKRYRQKVTPTLIKELSDAKRASSQERLSIQSD